MGVAKIRYDDDFRPEEEVNQDRYLIRWGPGGKAEALAAVVDGITHARYGSGSLAAEIVTRSLEEAWGAGRLTTPEAVCDVLGEANERVVAEGLAAAREAGDEGPGAGDLMGASAAVCVVREGRAHVVSCGDTRVYLWSRDDGLLLVTPDHNELNRTLLAGAEWADVAGREDGEALTSHLGHSADGEAGPVPQPPEFFSETLPLRPGELMILCTDGLTDYFSRTAVGKGRWDAEDALAGFLKTAGDRSVKRLSEELVNEANRNGGGDNITVVILRVAEAAPPAGPGATRGGSSRKRR
jgi:protein phosphatase